MEQALKSLKEEKFTLILTSNHSWPPHGYEVLKRVGIENLLDRVVFSGEIGKAKPHPDIFKKAFDGFSNDEILHVGDNPIADVDGSQSYGTYALWVKSRDHFRERHKIEPLRKERLAGEIKDITELPDFLGVNPIEF
jgi:FMN phosphatase YigB (HAD superfamily)